MSIVDIVGKIGIVECRESIINSVGIINDLGGSSELPVGRYRVQVMRAWDDYEIGGRAEGMLLDEADIEIARKAGTTGFPATDPQQDLLTRVGLNPLGIERVRRVLFAISDFTEES